MAPLSTDHLLRSSKRRGSGHGPRRLLGFLFVLLTAAGVIALGHARVPPAAPHAYVAPPAQKLPPISVCWIETGRFITATGGALLVRNPRGDVLIDAGNSSHFHEETSGLPFLVKDLLRSFTGKLGPSLPLPQALAAAGVPPASLKGVLITHVHPDHVGGALDLPSSVPILASPAELAFARAMRDQRTFHVLPAHADALRSRGVPIAFQPRPYESFEESADLFGDGTAVVVKLPGHTPGSLGVFLTLPSGERLFQVGDAANEVVEIEKGLSKRRAMGFTDFDAARAHETVATLKALHEHLPALKLLPAHDRAAHARAFGKSPRCIP